MAHVNKAAPRGPGAERCRTRRGTARGMARVTQAVPCGSGAECAAAISGVGRIAAWLGSPGRRPGGRMPSAHRSFPAWEGT